MQNCSNRQSLPTVYEDSGKYDYSHCIKKTDVTHPLQIYNLSYLHYHGSLELGVCASGSGICYVENCEYPFSAGDVQIIFPFQPHISCNAPGQTSHWYWLNIDCEKILATGGFTDIRKVEAWLSSGMALCGIFKKSDYPEINRMVRSIIENAWVRPEDSPYHRELVCSYLYTLLLELLRASDKLPKLNLPRNRKLTAISPALDMINEMVQKGEQVASSDLACACAMSPASFRRTFSDAIGIPPKEYMMRCLIKKSEQLLLTTDKSIVDISEESGFCNISGFNRQFMQKNGISPSQFRKNYHSLYREN